MNELDEVEVDLVFDRPKPPKCKNCGRDKGSHQAKTFNCPATRSKFTYFLKTVYEPKDKK